MGLISERNVEIAKGFVNSLCGENPDYDRFKGFLGERVIKKHETYDQEVKTTTVYPIRQGKEEVAELYRTRHFERNKNIEINFCTITELGDKEVQYILDLEEDVQDGEKLKHVTFQDVTTLTIDGGFVVKIKTKAIKYSENKVIAEKFINFLLMKPDYEKFLNLLSNDVNNSLLSTDQESTETQKSNVHGSEEVTNFYFEKVKSNKPIIQTSRIERKNENEVLIHLNLEEEFQIVYVGATRQIYEEAIRLTIKDGKIVNIETKRSAIDLV